MDTGAKTPTFKRSKLAGCETLPSSPNSVAQAQDCLLESQASKNFLWLKSSSNGKSQGIQSPTSFPGTEEESCNEVIEEDRSASGLKDNRLEYYTTELMPPVSVSCVRTGSKMKRVSAIPGRRKSAGPSGQVIMIASWVLMKKRFCSFKGDSSFTLKKCVCQSYLRYHASNKFHHSRANLYSNGYFFFGRCSFSSYYCCIHCFKIDERLSGFFQWLMAIFFASLFCNFIF